MKRNIEMYPSGVSSLSCKAHWSRNHRPSLLKAKGCVFTFTLIKCSAPAATSKTVQLNWKWEIFSLKGLLRSATYTVLPVAGCHNCCLFLKGSQLQLLILYKGTQYCHPKPLKTIKINQSVQGASLFAQTWTMDIVTKGNHWCKESH